MQNTAIIRRIDGELAWYPPGASAGAHSLHLEAEQLALRAAISESRIVPIFAVPGGDVRLLSLTITAPEKRHFSKSLPFTLEEELAVDVDELHFASCEVAPLEYAVAVSSTEHMREYANSLASLPEIGQWIPEPLLLPWQEGEWCLVLEAGVAIVRTGACDGFAIEREMLPAFLAAAQADNGEPDAVIVYGEQQDEDIALLPESLRGRAQWRRGDFYSAMMLAEQPNPALNLRQGEYARRLPLARWWRQAKVAAVLFAVGLALHMVATGFDYRQLKEQNLALRGAREASFRQVFPRGAISDVEKQLRNQLGALSGTGAASGFASLMERVGKVVSTSKGTNIVSINYNAKADEMRLNILAANYGEVERVREGINGAGLEATMENSSAQGERVRARLRVRDRS
ncbi:hypothetical protein EY643_04825 [Halioglobus maricola]|uniref:Type II secretion system protein L n=1 Tax=Halioglobus maricola TaxID=2601894 RepID=A0A5P9NGW6_9GAMM|nr:type II secretion system protein GspL [Halioglobus maricola]QFU75022.1 hypothetical protein EY643_04825 [Halioglobus maricola]